MVSIKEHLAHPLTVDMINKDLSLTQLPRDRGSSHQGPHKRRALNQHLVKPMCLKVALKEPPRLRGLQHT